MTSLKTRTRLFLQSQPFMVLSTAFPDAQPHTSTMLFDTDDKLNLYIVTRRESLKTSHLRDNPRASGAVWEVGNLYVQWRGIAKEMTDQKQIDPRMKTLVNKAIEIKKFWPPFFKFHGHEYCVFRIRPTWLRAMDLKHQTISEATEKNGESPYMQTIIGKRTPRRRRA